MKFSQEPPRSHSPRNATTLYKVSAKNCRPQASLRQLGVLNYSPELADKIDRGVPIEHDSKPEIEIRAATLIAIELIKQNFIENGQNINSVQANNALWLLSKQPKFKAKPYHLTKTIYY